MFDCELTKPMKRKELFWMLAPCAFLVLMALWLRGRPGATLLLNEPFSVLVEKVEKEALNAREVSDGWDTKLKITLTHKGPTPQWWGQPVDDSGFNDGVRLFYDHKGKQSAVKAQQPTNLYSEDFLLWRPVWDQENQRYIARLLLPLAKVPLRPGSVKVQARIVFEKNNTPLCPPGRLETIVRRPGEVVRVPTISKDSHLGIEKFIIEDVPPAQLKAEGYTADTRIEWKVRYYDTGENTTYSAGVEVQLYDAHGATYSPNYAGGEGGLSPQQSTTSAVADFDVKSIPRSAGALTLRGHIGIGSYWPLKVEIPIRDSLGRVLKTPQTPAPFTIGAITVRSADAEAKQERSDLVVSIGIQFKHPPKNVSYTDWQADWSPHLVDETGKEYWTFKTPYPVGPQPLAFGTTYSTGSVHSIEYVIPLNQVPASAKIVKFKTQIGYEHSARVPVEVLLRSNGITQLTG